ncbi:MAG: hypothetical protein HZC02_03455 [Candidatus Levybacteria bacterium]|nr:hypothetical protein [Candidatus Levybacteria bacterium]
MRIFPKNILIQNIDSFLLRENFLVSAVSTIFIIRFILKVSHYPQLGTDSLHIAHLVWGGLFMLAGFMLIFSFLSKGALSLGSILGGIGFGAFIDELGKFITRDNNYFFQPTIAIIYVIFIILYIFSKLLSQREYITKQEYLINALEMIKEAAINDLDNHEKKTALVYLEKSDQGDPLVRLLKSFLKDVESIPQPEKSLWGNVRSVISEKYYQFARSEIVRKLIFFILILQVAVETFFSLSITSFNFEQISFIQLGLLLSTTSSTLFIIAGVIMIVKNKYFSYILFKIAILIGIFLTQFFLFYQEQLSAVIGLFVSILLLAVVDYGLHQEKVRIK